MGYKYAHIVPLDKIRQEPFFVKKQGNESAVHTYVVEVLRQYFWAHGIRPKRWITVGADLMLRQKHKKKRLAIEVETGHAYRIRKNGLIKKFNYMLKRYDVVIIVTNSYYLARYKYRFPKATVLLRKEVIPFFSRRLFELGHNPSLHYYYRRKKREPKLSASTMMYLYEQEYGVYR